MRRPYMFTTVIIIAYFAAMMIVSIGIQHYKDETEQLHALEVPPPIKPIKMCLVWQYQHNRSVWKISIVDHNKLMQHTKRWPTGLVFRQAEFGNMTLDALNDYQETRENYFEMQTKLSRYGFNFNLVGYDDVNNCMFFIAGRQ